MKEQDEIEQLFSSSFEGFEKTPPLDVKDAIDARLFSGGVVNEAPSKRRKGIIWWFALAILIGLSGLGGYWMTSTRNAASQHAETAGTVSIENEGKTEKLAQNSNNQVKSEQRVSSIPSEKDLNESLSQKSSTKNQTINTNKESEKRIKKSSTTLNNSLQSTPTSNKKKVKKSAVSLDENLIAASAFNESNVLLHSKMDEDEPSNQSVNESQQKENTSSIANTDQNDSKENSETAEAVDTSSVKSAEIANTSNNNSPTKQPEIMQPKVSPFSISIFGGTTYGMNSLNQPSTSNFKMKESFGFSSSVELNYALNPRFGLSAGLDVNSRMENFYRIDQVNDSVFIGLVPQYVYDPQNTDSIIDTLYVEEYDVTSNSVERPQFIRHTSFALPLAFNWNIYTKGNWNYRLGTVVRLSYVNNKLVNNENALEVPEFKKFSARLSLRPQVDYTIGKFAIGAYLSVGYDLIPTMNWTDISRNRMDIGGGLVLRYKF